MTAIPTNQQMLNAVNTAIYNRLNGGVVASYGINGRNLQYVSIPELYKFKRDLENKIAATNGTGRNFVKFVNPT